MLVDSGDAVAAQPSEFVGREVADLAIFERQLRGFDTGMPGQIAQHRQRHRAFAGAGFAHQPERFALADPERYVIDRTVDVPGSPVRNGEVLDV